MLLVPLAVRYLGAEKFGLWAAITSLAPLVALADLGIGNGLINAVAAGMARDDTAATRRAVSSSLAAVAAMAGLLLLVLAVLSGTIDWAGLFNVTGTAAAPGSAAPATLAYIACCLALLPLTLVSRLRAGLQESFISSGWEAAGVATALLGFILAIRMQAGMPTLLVAIGLPPVIAGIGNRHLR